MNLTIKKILISHYKNESNKEEVIEKLKKEDIDIYEYNKTILELVSDPKIKNKPKNEKLNKYLDKKIINHIYQIKSKENENTKIDISLINNISFFYNIKNSPSYLKFESLLNKEDLESFINIYTEICGVKYDSNVILYLLNELEEYKEKIIKKYEMYNKTGFCNE